MKKLFKNSVFNITKYNFSLIGFGKKKDFSSMVFKGMKNDFVSKTKFGSWDVSSVNLFSRNSSTKMVFSDEEGWKRVKIEEKVGKKSKDSLKDLRRFVAGYLSEGDGITLFTLKRSKMKDLIVEAIEKDSQNAKNPFLLECVLKCAIYEFTRASDQEPWKKNVPGRELLVKIFAEHAFYEYVFFVIEKEGVSKSAVESLKIAYSKNVTSYLKVAFLKVMNKDNLDRDVFSLVQTELIEDYFLKELEKKIKDSQIGEFLGIKGVFKMMLVEVSKNYAVFSDDKNWHMMEALLGIFMDDARKNKSASLLPENSVAVTHILEGMRIQSGLDK